MGLQKSPSFCALGISNESATSLTAAIYPVLGRITTTTVCLLQTNDLQKLIIPHGPIRESPLPHCLG